MSEGVDLAVRLWPLLDGRSGVEALAEKLDEDEERVNALLEGLAGQGLVTAKPVPPTAASILDAAMPASRALRPVEGSTVRVLGDSVLAEYVVDALGSWGAHAEHAGEPATADLLVAVERHPRSDRLRATNRFAITHGMPALFAEWRGLTARVGPTWMPQAATPCWECVDLRAWGNAVDPDVHEAERVGSYDPFDPVPPAHAGALANLVALEAARLLRTGTGSLVNRQIRLDLWNLSGEPAPLLPVPGCPACGASRELAAPDPNPVPGARVDILTLEDRLVHPESGILARMGSPAPEAGEFPISVFTAVVAPAVARRLAGQPRVRWRTPLYGTGVALDPQVARARALGEAVERYALATVAHSRFHRAPWAEVADEAIHPRELAATSDSEQAAHPELRTFDEDARHDWVWALDLQRSRPVRVLASLALPGLPRPSPEYLTPCLPNGTACGGTWEAAASGALREAIERDALMLAWATPSRPCRVRPDTVESPGFHAIRAFTEAHGRELHLFDLTSDLPVPTFAALIVDRTGRGPALAMGTGCRLDPAAAAQKAAEEAVHMRARYRSLYRGRPSAADAHGPARWWHADRLDDFPWPLEKADEAALPPASADNTDASEQFRQLERAVTSRGLHPVLVDATPPDVATLGLHVASVLVPGLIPKTHDGVARHWGTPRLRKALRGSRPSRLPLPFP